MSAGTQRAALLLLGVGLVAGGVLWLARAPRPTPRGPARGGRGFLDAGPRVHLEGRILDRAGHPIAGARVAAWHLRDARARAVAGTDEAGAFALELGPGPHRLLVEAEGYAALELSPVEGPLEGLELRLARRLAISGVVRSAGRPVPGAELVLQRAGRAPLEGRAGFDGSFSLPAEEGRYALRAAAEGRAALLEDLVVDASPDGGTPSLVVELGPASVVRGRLLDRGGLPIVGGRVTLLEGPTRSFERSQSSGADGAFLFSGVVAGAHLLLARAAEHLPGPARAIEAPSPPVELRLERGAVLEGRVLDESAQPIAGAVVEVAGESAEGAPIAVSSAAAAMVDGARLDPGGELGILRGPIPFPPSTPLAASLAPPAGGGPVELGGPAGGFTTDARGAFRLVGLPPGRLTVAAVHPAFARGTSTPVRVAAGQTAQIEVVLRQGKRVEGRVVDDRGEAILGAEVSGPDGRPLAITDGHGRFVVPNVVDPIELTARRGGFLPASERIDPAAAATLELRLVRAEGRLAGEVVDDRGTRLGGARVEVTVAGGPPRTAVTDRGGRFLVDGLPPGPYRVRAAHPDFQPVVLERVPPGDELRLQVDPGAALDGELRDARTGAPPAGATLELQLAGERRPLALRGGRFAAYALPPGRAVLRARAPGYVTLEEVVELPPGERPREVTAPDLRLELERGGAVEGEVTGADDQPAVGVLVSVGGITARTDARGAFRVDGVAPGRAEAEAKQGAERGHEEVEVRADAVSRVVLRLR